MTIIEGILGCFGSLRDTATGRGGGGFVIISFASFIVIKVAVSLGTPKDVAASLRILQHSCHQCALACSDADRFQAMLARTVIGSGHKPLYRLSFRNVYTNADYVIKYLCNC